MINFSLMPRQPRNKKLSELLNQNQTIKRSSILKSLFAGAVSRESAHDRVEECLPEYLKGQFVVAGLNNGVLTLHCCSAALATRFRFEQDRILKALQMRIGRTQVTSIKIQIRPNTTPKSATSKQRKSERRDLKSKTMDERLNGVLERLNSRSK